MSLAEQISKKRPLELVLENNKKQKNIVSKYFGQTESEFDSELIPTKVESDFDIKVTNDEPEFKGYQDPRKQKLFDQLEK